MPGLPEKAQAEGLTPLEYMRRYGAFEVARGVGRSHERGGARGGARGRAADAAGPRLHARREARVGQHRARSRRPIRDAAGRRPVGVDRRRGAARLPDAERQARVLLLDAGKAGAGPSTRCPTYIRATCTRRISRTTRCRSSPRSGCPFRSTPAARTRNGSTRSRTPTRSGSTRAHAATLGVATGDLVRVETRIGHFVVKAWVTEGIRPGVVACSHHMGRWKLEGPGQRQVMATVSLERRRLALAAARGSGTSSRSSPTTRTPRASGGPTRASTRT